MRAQRATSVYIDQQKQLPDLGTGTCKEETERQLFGINPYNKQITLQSNQKNNQPLSGKHQINVLENQRTVASLDVK